VPARFAAAIRADLRAGLEPSDIGVCAAGAGEPLARISIETSDAATYRLSVEDSVTQGRTQRELSLEKLPLDGRAFALAVAVEELLRARWANSALRRVHSPETAAPPQARAVAEAERRPTPAPRFVALGARFAFERFLGGQTHYGADLFGSLPLGSIAGGLLAIGARRALSEQALHGAIGASGFSAELGFSVAFLRRGSLELGAFVSERLLRLSFEPEAKLGATSRARHGLVVTSRAGLGLAWGRAGLLRSYTMLGAGLPLKSFSAADGNTTVTGASELELFASAGLALELP
jgi:hypothetical protein